MHDHSGCIDIDEISEDLAARKAHLALLRGQMMQVLPEFDHAEQEILKKRFGLDDTVFYSLQDIQEELGVAPEDVIELELRMLEKAGESNWSE